MRTSRPIYLISVEGVAVQVGRLAEPRAAVLRGNLPLRSLYAQEHRGLPGSNYLVSAVPQVLAVLHPDLLAALDVLRDGAGKLALDADQRLALASLVFEARSEMGSNNYKLQQGLAAGLLQDEDTLIAAFDQSFRVRHSPLILTLKGLGLSTPQVEAFVNCTPFHEDACIVRNDDSWRVS